MYRVNEGLMRKAPIFILAAPRSFSTITAAILGGHPQAYSVPELNLLIKDYMKEFMVENRDVYFMQMHGILRTVSELYAGEQTMDTISMAHRWIRKRIDKRTSEIYDEICRKIYPLTLVDKSPAYTITPDRLHRIKKSFPDAYILHLTRHPVAMNKSMCKLEKGKLMAALADSVDYSSSEEIVDPQLLWHTCNSMTLEFMETIDERRKLTIKGEDIINNRVEALEKVCSWLEWEWSEDIYEMMMHPEDSVYANFGPIGAELGGDPNFLRSPEIRDGQLSKNNLEEELKWLKKGRRLYPHVKELAQQLGYE